MTGTLPPAFTADTFRDGEWINEPKLYQRLWRPVNAIRRALAPLELVWVGAATASFNVASGITTGISMGTTLVDTLGIGLGATGGFVPPADGLYEVAAANNIGASTAGTRRICLVMVNAVETVISTRGTHPPAASGSVSLCGASALLPLKKGDIVFPAIFQDSGVSLATGTAVTARPTLSVRRWA
jgi:hypothetical protein